MKVKMKTLKAGPAGVIRPGQVVTVDDAEGQALVSGGYATAIVEAIAEAEAIPAEVAPVTDEPPTAASPKVAKARKPRKHA